MNAFKSQQHRWAKGSIQTALQAAAAHPPQRTCRSHVKREAFFHLTANFAYLLMIPLALLMPLIDHGARRARLVRGAAPRPPVLRRRRPRSVCSFYFASQREIGHERLAAGQVHAVPDGARDRPLGEQLARGGRGAASATQSGFTRTPEARRAAGRRARSRASATGPRSPSQPLVELALAAYMTYGDRVRAGSRASTTRCRSCSSSRPASATSGWSLSSRAGSARWRAGCEARPRMPPRPWSNGSGVARAGCCRVRRR